ncbi:spore germination protein [Paenisporosarcina sp.]|uniref:spore germination protein n=1 Tax=Paenisporosarcina sp. TaxID=1932001 RepID=UPI003C773E4A
MKFFKKTSTPNNPVNESQLLTADINKNIQSIRDYLCHTEDLMVKEMIFNKKTCTILYLDSMVNKDSLQSSVIGPIVEAKFGEIQNIVKATEVKLTSKISDVGSALLEGFCTILIETDAQAMSLSVVENTSRSIEEPDNERSIISSHDGFVENLGTNIFQLRKRVKSPQLKVKFFTLGKLTNTKISMVYMENLANEKIIEEVERRISSIEVDQLLSFGDLQDYIEDNPYSPFPQMLTSERPDRGAAYLTEGKILLLVDGSPRILIVPITFFAFYQTPDDYNSRWLVGTFFRLIRFFSFIISISLPAIYIAVVSFHSEVLPIGILYSIRVSLENVPFPPYIEAFAMQIILELLKEAAIRLPTPISQTIGIVGGLVIGTAVVEASFVSNTMIVVIGLTAIASFVAPVNEMGTSARLLGFPVMIAASLFGFVGIVLVLMLIFMHVCKLETFGTPYFAPIAPFKIEDIKDSIVRLPFWKLNTRPTDSKPVYKKQQWRTRGWKNN